MDFDEKMLAVEQLQAHPNGSITANYDYTKIIIIGEYYVDDDEEKIMAHDIAEQDMATDCDLLRSNGFKFKRPVVVFNDETNNWEYEIELR